MAAFHRPCDMRVAVLRVDFLVLRGPAASCAACAAMGKRCERVRVPCNNSV